MSNIYIYFLELNSFSIIVLMQTQFSVDFFFSSHRDSLSYGLLAGSAQGMNEECVMKEGSCL